MQLRATRLTAIAHAVRRAVAPAAFTPATLFGASDQGVWYDPSDFSTLFQDSAGTTPVTALEQPVGLMLDKSGRGNHATQPTATSRPVVSARVNLLTKTEQFDDAVWSPSTRIVVTPNDTISPNGLQTADKIAETADNGTHRVTQSVIFASNTQYKLSCYWKKERAGGCGYQ